MNRITFFILPVMLSILSQVPAQSMGESSGVVTANRLDQRQSYFILESHLPQDVSETGGMTSGELVVLMLAQNAQLKAAREQLRQAEARLTQARLRPNPSFEVEGTTDALFKNQGEGGYSFAVSQPFELGGKRAKRVRVGQLFIEETKAQIADRERQLAGQMRALIGDALTTAAKLELLERLSGLNRQMTRVMEVRLRSGDAAKLDSSLLLAATNQLEAQRLQTESQVAGLLLEIKTLAGVSPEEAITLRGGLQATDISLSPEAAWKAALAYRPDLHAARLHEELAEEGVVLTKAQAVPSPSAFVRYTKDRILIEGLLPPSERIVHTDSVLSFGISIPLPIFNRQQGNIAEAASLVAQARAEREELERLVRRDVLLAHRRYATARRTLDVLNRGVLTESQESFRITRLAYELGELRLLDVVNQERLFIEAQMSYVAAQKEFYTARVDLERAIGKDLASTGP